MLELFGLGRHARLFGEGVEPLTIAGAVSEAAAAETGLPPERRFGRLADGPAMALGLGATDESLISVIAGTWGLNQLSSRTPITDGSISAPIFGPRPGEFVLTDAGPTSASAFEWLVNSVLAPRRCEPPQPRRAVRFLQRRSIVRAAGRRHPYFLPYLNGRLDQPEARGCLIGLSSWHGLPDIIRAVYEGVAFEHCGHIDRLLMRPPAAARRPVCGRRRPQPAVARDFRLGNRPAARTRARRTSSEPWGRRSSRRPASGSIPTSKQRLRR